MASTLSHRGSRLVTREELLQLDTPTGTHSHRPIPHFELIEAIHSEVEKRALVVKREKYAVQRDDDVLFGTMDLDWMDTGEEAAAIGIRQANDKSMSIQLAIGLRVFVCDNLMFSGDVIALKRRHTSKLDLGKEISEGLDRYQSGFHQLRDDVAIWKNTDLKQDTAKLMIYDIFRKKIVPQKLFNRVDETYFAEKTPKTQWGLHNAFTEHVQVLKPERKFSSTIQLGRYFQRDYASV